MPKITMREVYRTIIDAKKYEWAEYRASAPPGSKPELTMEDFMKVLRKSELLVDRVSIRQKWQIAIDQGVLIPESKAICRVNLALLEIKSGVNLPRGMNENVCVSESCHADARIREGGVE